MEMPQGINIGYWGNRPTPPQRDSFRVDAFITRDKKAKRGYIKLKTAKRFGTPASWAISVPGTGGAQPCLTSVIGRELVYSRWYDRIILLGELTKYCYLKASFFVLKNEIRKFSTSLYSQSLDSSEGASF